MPEEFDVVCLGAGPAGEGLAAELKGSGLTLAAVEANKVGGECPYWGCVPSKTMLRAAEVLAEANRAIDFSVSQIEYKVDYGKVYQRLLDSARGLDDTKSAKGLVEQGATLFRGEGRLAGPRTVVVDGTELVAHKAVVIATGTRPAIPDLPGLDSVDFWTNRDVLFTPELPRSMIVLGAGPAGVEIGQAFVRFGSKVTMLENGPRVLGPEEPEAGDYVQGYLVEEGMEIVCSCGIDGVEAGGEGIIVRRGSDAPVSAERLLVSVGRRPNSECLEVDAAGIKLDRRGFVAVERDTLEAGDGIFAAGDINGIGGFTHLSDYQGHVVGKRIKGEQARANHAAIPRVTYCDPEVASVGISEAQGREQGINVKVVKGDVGNDTRGWIHGKPGGVIKVVADADRRVLVGATLVGPRSGELLNEISLALRTQASLDLLADLIHPFPSFGRIFQHLFHELAG